MLLLRKLLAVQKADAMLPGELRMAPVDSVYSPLASLIAGAISGGITCAIVSARTDDVWLSFFSAAILACGLARLASATLYDGRRDHGSRRQARLRWEQIHAFGAWATCGLIGLQGALAIFRSDDPAVHLVVATMSTSYAAGMLGRCAGRAQIAIGQQTLAALPLSLALMIHGNWLYVGLGLVFFLFTFAMIDITLSIRDIIAQALAITRDKVELAARFEEQAKRFDAALTNMSHGLCMFDGNNRLAVWNARFLAVTGLPDGSVHAGASVNDLVRLGVRSGNHSWTIARRLVAGLARQLAVDFHGQAEATLADGRTVSLSQRAMPQGGSVVIFEDITQRKTTERHVARRAQNDELTGLANRTTFREQILEALAKARQGGEKLAVHWIDLDRFKSVNDTLGHPVGDSLLREVAQRLQMTVRQTDVVARFGGDEFVVLQTPIRRADDAAKLARRFVEVVTAPFHLDGQQIDIGASIGIALSPRDGTDTDRLLKSADLALYRAKADGRCVVRFFEKDMDAGAQARRALELDLRRAWERGEFDIHYQPLVNLAAGRIVACEALVRWQHPQRGMVPPNEFIPIAEETGLIVPLGEWVLRQACAEATNWPSHIRLAVNLSPLQFKNRNLTEFVVAVLARSGLLASRLELEVTEMVLLQDSELTLSTMAQLRQLGVRLSLDDFGTGYSSLSYLRKFPFQKIKLDRSFIKGLGRDAGSVAVIRRSRALDAISA
jgi:diguanylate cyclase (GGDEF)-like protein